MRLAFISTVNLHVTPAHPGEIVVFFNEKCALHQPPLIPCVFSGKMRLAFLVTVNSYDTRATALGFRIFFQLKRASQESWRIPQIHFHCVFSGTMRLRFTSQCEFTCDAAFPCRMPFLFARENAPRGNRREVSKLEESHMLTKEHCK